MPDVISALTIISVCSVLLAYWVVRMIRLCSAPTEPTDETLGSSKQAIKAEYGARFFAGDGVHCAPYGRPALSASGRPRECP
jgi:hypothetical protein